MNSALLSTLDKDHELVFFDTIDSFANTVTQESEALLRAAPSIHSGQQDLCNRLLLLVKCVVFIGRIIVLVMNAAVTIFGLGVGVGLILGDTLRGRSSVSRETRELHQDAPVADGIARMPEPSSSRSSLSEATSCGTRLRRTNRVEAPPQSRRACALPAQ